MAENKNSFEDVLTNLALIVDGAQSLFPMSKSVLIFELNQQDFTHVKSNFKYLKVDENQIKIDISGTEVIFILENSYKLEQEVEETPEEVEKQTFFKKVKNLFSSKVGS